VKAAIYPRSHEALTLRLAPRCWPLDGQQGNLVKLIAHDEVMVNRGELLIARYTGTAIAWSLATSERQKAMPVIGYLGGTTPDTNATFVAAFRRGLNETGDVEGQNVAIEYSWAERHYDRLPTLAADLVGRKVDLIAANDIPSAQAAKSATSSISIIFVIGGDPVAAGLVTSLGRPGAIPPGGDRDDPGSGRPRRHEHGLMPRGAAAGGLAWADVDAKYRALVPLADVPPARLEASLALIHEFRGVPAVGRLIELLGV
jgi:hypothetical protein